MDKEIGIGDQLGVGELAKSSTELLKAVPIYQDLAQPAMQEAGKALGTVVGAVGAALLPLRMMIWGADQIEPWLKSRLAFKLKDTPIANIITPDPQVIGPAVEALRFVAGNETLREMYAALIATAMDSDTARTAHPSFVETLKQITPHEAKIIDIVRMEDPLAIAAVTGVGFHPAGAMLKNVALDCWADVARSCDYEDDCLTDAYFLNLVRLGIIGIKFGVFKLWQGDISDLVRASRAYSVATSRTQCELVAQGCSGIEFEIEKGVAYLTPLGVQFVAACGLTGRETPSADTSPTVGGDPE